MARTEEEILPTHSTLKERLGCPCLTPAQAGRDVGAGLRADNQHTHKRSLHLSNTHTLLVAEGDTFSQGAGLSCSPSPRDRAGARAQAMGRRVEMDVPHPA